jgi:hypothetical protein
MIGKVSDIFEAKSGKYRLRGTGDLWAAKIG